MDSDDTPIETHDIQGRAACNCHECREERGWAPEPLKWAPGATTPESGHDAPNVNEYERRFEGEVVGLDGETRAEVRKLILKTLTDFTREVRTAQDEGEIDSLKAFRLRLQIHRERCALLGLGYANGVTW